MSIYHTEDEVKEILFKEANELIRKFVYIHDEENYGRVEDWRIPKEREDGRVYDDCDGYAMYLWNKLKDYDLESQIIFCEIPVKEGYGGHAILYCEEWLMDCNHLDPFRKTDVPTWKWNSISDPVLSPDGWKEIVNESKDDIVWQSF